MESEGHSLGVLEFQKEELVERHMYSDREIRAVHYGRNALLGLECVRELAYVRVVFFNFH